MAEKTKHFKSYNIINYLYKVIENLESVGILTVLDL